MFFNIGDGRNSIFLSSANNDIHLIRLCRVRRVTQENICLLIEKKEKKREDNCHRIS